MVSGVRLIAVDVETAEWGHLVEVGCVEILDGRLSGRQLHRHVRPQVPVNPFALAKHGLTDAFLRKKQPFSAIVDEMLAFMADAPLVAHNQSADRGNINLELDRLGRPTFASDRFLCTMRMAKARGGFASHGLREVCRALGIAVDHLPDLHGALEDATLAAHAYIRLSVTSEPPAPPRRRVRAIG